jgi:hypothetical protein
MTDGNIPFVATIFFRATSSEYDRMRSYWEMIEEDIQPHAYIEGSGYREDAQRGEVDIYLYDTSILKATYRVSRILSPLMESQLRSVTGLGIYTEDDFLNNN